MAFKGARRVTKISAQRARTLVIEALAASKKRKRPRSIGDADMERYLGHFGGSVKVKSKSVKKMRGTRKGSSKFAAI